MDEREREKRGKISVGGELKGYPTGLFKICEPRDQEIGEFY